MGGGVQHRAVLWLKRSRSPLKGSKEANKHNDAGPFKVARPRPRVPLDLHPPLMKFCSAGLWTLARCPLCSLQSFSASSQVCLRLKYL